MALQVNTEQKYLDITCVYFSKVGQDIMFWMSHTAGERGKHLEPK